MKPSLSLTSLFSRSRGAQAAALAMTAGALLLTPVPSHAEKPVFSDYYKLETIGFPEGVPPEVGAIGFNEEGEIVVALRRSDVLVAKPTEKPEDFQWRLFGRGLHNACGIQVISKDEVIISQMPELTRLKDTDGDGEADLYESVSAPWGMSGNYHETNHFVPDGKGGYFVAVGTASHNGPVFYNVRGEYSKMGRRGRNYSAVQWKGWVLHIGADGTMTPWCKGFRMHNGLAMDKDGNLWCGDNQGDWRATTPFYHLEKGNFYGHPGSLIWDPEWDPSVDPLKLPLEKIDEMRTPAAVLLPHALMNRSASEPLQIPDDAQFGPYAGQFLLPDNNGERICRIMLEKVEGQFQGACTKLFNENGLHLGNNRVVFSPDKKTLYVGQTSRGWGNLAEGLQRLTWQGKVPFDILTMSLTKDGFRLTFTQPVKKETVKAENFGFKTYHYQNGPEYGGDQLDMHDVPVKSVSLVDEKTVDVVLSDALVDGEQVYELHVAEGLTNGDGVEIWSPDFCYTVNKLRK